MIMTHQEAREVAAAIAAGIAPTIADRLGRFADRLGEHCTLLEFAENQPPGILAPMTRPEAQKFLGALGEADRKNLLAGIRKAKAAKRPLTAADKEKFVRFSVEHCGMNEAEAGRVFEHHRGAPEVLRDLLDDLDATERSSRVPLD
jgi:hypothetical protein